MDSKVEEENLKMTKTTPSPPSFSSSSSSLPSEIIVNCLAWTSRSYYPSLYLVSKSFYSLLSSPEIYTIRTQIGAKEACLYVCLSGLICPTSRDHHRWFILGEFSLERVKLFPSSDSYYARLISATNVAVSSEIYQIGENYKRSKAVFVLDCQSHTWRRAPSLTVARKRPKSWFLDGKIYVIGGCNMAEEEPMNWGEVFDLKTQTWKPLTNFPSSDDDGFDTKHEVLVFGGRLYVVTKNNKYAYDPEEGRWVLVPEGSVVGLELISSLIPHWCVIKNVIFADFGEVKWYNARYERWDIVYGLDDLYKNRDSVYSTIQLVDHGGKLVIIWYEWSIIKFVDSYKRGGNKEVWCAVIRLEKQQKFQFRGVVERCHVVLRDLEPCNHVSCLSVSV